MLNWHAVALGMLAVSVVLSLVLGRPLIATLHALEYQQRAYEDAPPSHASKTGTPTMGGILFLGALLLGVAVWRDPAAIALVVLGLLGGAIGLVDDYASIRLGRNRGLRARTKFFATALAGVVFLALALPIAGPSGERTIFILGGWAVHAPLAIWYAVSLLVIVATTHAVNLSDGLDGLAAGTVLPPLAFFAVLAWRANEAGVAVVVCSLAGAVIGFLAYNYHPAKIFMGDTGSLALGGVVAGSAILTGTQLLLPLVGGVFAAEALSVILQVAYFKRTSKRIFRMSPLHHHFELGGWPETKVTRRFWAASALLSAAGLAIAR